jgi:hypothetical protein
MAPEEIEPRVAETFMLLQTDIEEASFYVRPRHPEDAVFCMIAGKSLRLGFAVCRLVSGGFYGEAFGLSRSVLEAFFIAKYIGNDPEVRAKSYMEFVHAHAFNREEIREQYFPLEDRPAWYTQQFKDLVRKKYPNSRQWQPAFNMATEPSLHPQDFNPNTGKGFQAFSDYNGTYELTSQYVHCTIVSSAPNFSASPYIPPMRDQETDRGFLALHFSLAYARLVCLLLSRHWDRVINKEIMDKIDTILSDLRDEASPTAVWRFGV